MIIAEQTHVDKVADVPTHANFIFKYTSCKN